MWVTGSPVPCRTLRQGLQPLGSSIHSALPTWTKRRQHCVGPCVLRLWGSLRPWKFSSFNVETSRLSSKSSKRRRIFALVQFIWKGIESRTGRCFQNAQDVYCWPAVTWVTRIYILSYRPFLENHSSYQPDDTILLMFYRKWNSVFSKGQTAAPCDRTGKDRDWNTTQI